MNISKNPSKILFSEYGWSHGEKFIKEREEDVQTSLGNCGEKKSKDGLPEQSQ